MSSKKLFALTDEDFLEAATASDDEFRTGSSGSGMFCRNVNIGVPHMTEL